MDNKNITAVVVTRNRKDMLRRCIGHLRAQQGACCSILVVDNASTDGTGELLAALAARRLARRAAAMDWEERREPGADIGL